MTNSSTPSAKRIMRPLPMTEKNTVERAIEIEDRVSVIESQLHELRYLNSEWFQCGQKPEWLADRIDDLESELSDLQKEYRG